ncbi:MAG: aldehyde dehydrogenase family protein, partial [Planctomycetota bacterium]
MQTRAFINNEWVGASSGKTFTVTNPATDEHLADVPDLSAGEVTDAVAAAYDAFPAWSARTAEDRCGLLDRLYDLIQRDTDRLADLMTREQGKPLAEAKGEIAYAASFLRNAAEEGKRLEGDILPASAPEKRILVMKQPVGVCSAITPWNFPSAMITRKIGPALAVGCTTLIKPAEDTPLSALALGELCLEAGIPAGVVNLVTGDPETVTGPMLTDSRVRKLTFTGSTEVGKILLKKAAENVLRTSMELGGHAPLIVFDDADLDVAIPAAIACK